MSAKITNQNSSNPIAVQSLNTLSSGVDLSIINSGTANITASIAGKAGVSKIEMTIVLQKYNNSDKTWKKIKSWDKLTNSARASFTTSYKLSSKGNYRCKLSAVVWKNGNGENITTTSDKKTY